MSPSYRVEVKRLLEQEAEQLQMQIKQQEKSAEPIPWQVGDDGDHAMNQIAQSNRQVLVGYLQRKLVQIQTARTRLDTGTYGTCAKCGHAIAPERLQALPYATLCIHCQSQQDRTKSRLTR